LSKKNIPAKVRYLLWAKSAGRCQFDGCNEPLFNDRVTQIEMNFAEVAHIIGQSPGGPRGDVKLSQEYCNDISNLMLLCPTHHRMIDEIVRKYSVETLRQMKKDHEVRIRRQTDIMPDKTSNLVIYRGNVGGFQPAIEYQDAASAMLPDYYPADYHALELGMSNSLVHDHEDEFWRNEVNNLEKQFVKKVDPLLGNNRQRNHFSVFAFAPIPLLIKLGNLLADIYPAQVYQLHKEPPTWDWQPEPAEFIYLVTEPITTRGAVALNLSLSADITDDRIFRALNTDDVSIWRMDVSETAFPKNDHLRSQGQLTQFSRKFRRLLNNIKARHGRKTLLHVFPAIPMAAAVELGRACQQKADLSMLIYDQNKERGGFHPTIQIS